MTKARHTKEVRRRCRVYITKISNNTHRALINETSDDGQAELGMLRLFTKDMADLFVVLYLFRDGQYKKAIDRWENLDTHVRESIPRSFIDFVERGAEL